ncbi:UNVERIFIED_CONTAM: hypothetical protein FKN15_057077 [Acipenser sinensis]
MNGQSDRQKTRFASWVTFDDDEDCFLPSSKPLKVDNFSHAPAQDSNSNLMISEGHSLKTEVTRNLFDLTPEKTNYVFTPDSPPANTRTPCSKINPFLDSKLLDVQPSPINPFSAYFDKQEPPLVDTSESNGSGSPPVYSFSSPFLNEGVDVKRDSVLLFSPVFDTSIHEDMFNNVPQNQTLEQLKQMQIADEADNPTMPDEPIDSDELDEPPFVPSHLEPKDGWPMMLRIPEKKSMMSSRHWGVIHVKLTEAGCLQLYYEKGMAKPFKTLQLNANHGLSEPKLQTFDENGKIHTIRIDHITYKEKKKYQPKVAVVHTPIIEQIVKLGTKNYEDFLSFISAVQNTLMSLPLDVDTYLRPSNYLEDEISIEVRDEFCGVVAKGDNRILRQSVVTHVSVLAFVSGTPVCRIGFNDVQIKGNEVVSRHDIVPNSTTRWIKLRDCQFNKYVDEKEFANTRSIAFVPPSAHRFELMRFRTAFAEKTLPFTLKTIATVKGAEVELQSWLVTSSGFSSNRDPLTLVPCENVMIRYPVGQTLIKNFRRESVTGEKSLKAKMNKGASFSSSSVSGTEPVMRVTLGTAKYEHAFKAVVWRINRLPDKNSATQQQVIVQDPKILQHMNATGMSAAATAATLALPSGVTPYQQLITNQGQILQVVRAPNGTQYIIQPQQQVLLQQQVIPQMQPGGVQAPVIQQVLAPIQGGIPQQTGVIIQPQQIVIAGNKVPQNAQVMQAATMVAAAAQAGQNVAQVQQQQQQQQPQPQMMLQVDGAGDTSSEEEEEEDEYDEDEEDDKDKDVGEDGQVEEEPLNSEDDVSDEEGQELFDTENVVVCQYDKIHRSKNKWKFHLKDGIMNLNGRDYVFSKAIGDAEW